MYVCVYIRCRCALFVKNSDLNFCWFIIIFTDSNYLAQAKHSTASVYNATDRIVEACRGQCTNKQSKLVYQVAFYKTLSGSMNA